MWLSLSIIGLNAEAFPLCLFETKRLLIGDRMNERASDSFITKPAGCSNKSSACIVSAMNRHRSHRVIYAVPVIARMIVILVSLF